MENKFHEKLFEALDFNKEHVSERIFVVEDRLQGERMIHDLSRSVGEELHVRVATPLEICSWLCLEEPKYQERILIHIGRAVELITEILEERSSSYNKYASEDIYQLAVRYYHQFALSEFTYKFGEDLSEEEWKECSYIHELYREKKIKQGLYDKPEMISEAQSILNWMEKWKKQHFVFLENFRCFGMEMKLIDCIPRECVTVVLQPDDKELTHLDYTNTYIKRATGMMNEVAEIFESIARNHRNLEECAIIYTDEAYAFLLAYMAARKQILLNHIGVPYDVLDLVKHLKQAKRSLDRGIYMNLHPGLYEVPEELEDVTTSLEKQREALIKVLYRIQERIGYTRIIRNYNPIYEKLVEIFLGMEDKKIFENRTVLDVFVERMEQIKSLEGGEGIQVIPIESAQFTGRKYLYVIGLDDKKLPVYDPSSKEILEDHKEMQVAYQGGYAHEVIPLARLLDVLGAHEGVTYLSYAICDDFRRYQDVLLPAPLYSMLKSRISLEEYLERCKNSSRDNL